MTRLVNLVGTVCKDGNQRALQDWYADHVHQLFADPGLLEARLAARQGGATLGDAPEYLCFYDFASVAAFEAYEAGPVRAAAAADRETGWGRDGIGIVLRLPLLRMYRRAVAAAPPLWTVSAFEADPVQRRQLVAALTGSIELFTSQPGYGQAPSTLLLRDAGAAGPPLLATVHWQAAYRFTTHWSR